ncbi:MAG TPA: hypothetical protein VHL11_22015 [Phototrophicaceae bacterium]|jgi:hypothetical protein|nr:hypothetical protein [Phototrophicaceae bacterium]
MNMRNFVTLDRVSINEDAGVIYIAASSEGELRPQLSLKREGGYVSISISSGPLEVALRPRYQELSRVLARLRPVNGLQTTRQVGTGQAYLAMGLRDDGVLVLRPTLVADATGLLCFNLLISDSARQQLFDWLPVEAEGETAS